MSQAHEDLKELLRRKGKTQAQAGSHKVYVNQIANGQRRAGPEVIGAIAEALGCTTDEVCAACDESYRRAHLSESAELPATPVTGKA